MTDRVISRYRLLSVLGAGGMGEVHLARDETLGRKVALKLLPANSARDLDRVRRFEREARAASALNHPNIVTVYEIGAQDDVHFIALEYVTGRTLRELIGQPVPLQTLAAIGSQIARALASAHDAGIVHRDIKPENLMVREDGYVKVLDFGVARLQSAPSLDSPETGITGPGVAVGTIRYMSPEQAHGEEATGASDVFALGLVLYELATGRHPFHAVRGPVGLWNVLSTQPVVPPSSFNPDLPADVDRLLAQMLDLDPRVRPCAAEISPALDRLSGTPGHERRPASVRAASPRRTVGRELERRALRAAFDAVVAGNGRILCVTGEPGIGKTTLIDELLAEVTRETPGCLVARGRSSERLAGTEAYLPWLEAIEDLLRSGAGSRIAATLRLVAPSWHGLVSSSHGAPETAVAAADAGSSDRLRRELAAFLQEVTRTRPLVLSFDDVHWADLSTLDLLSHIASRLPAVRLLIMLAYRPSELRETREPFLQLLRDLQARGICHDIPLEFLSRADVARYLELTCPGHRFPDDLPDLIHARTEGSPLFVTDLVAYLINRDVLAPMDGVWALHRPLSDIDHGLPESIRSMIERRIAQIEERDRWLLTVASVQGYAFDSAVLARALAIPASELEERLEALERLHAFVRSLEERELPDGTLSLRYRFQHQLYQNALYASLRPTRRSELSRSIAEALIELYGEAGIRVMDLANLFETARDWSRAVHYYEIAVRSAATIFAYHEVITLTGRGRTLITRLPDAAERDVRELALLEVLGPALSATRGYAVPGVVETYTRARELAQRSGTGQQLFTVLYNLWLVHDLRGQQHEARRLAEECVALAEGLDDSGTRVLASAAAGETRLWSADFEGALVALERGLEHYDPERHHSLAILYQYDPGVVSWVMAAHARWQLGYPDRAMQLVAQAIDVADRYAQPHSRALAWSHASLLHHLRGEIQPARARADTVQALASDRGFRFWEGYAEILIGRTLVGEGAVDEGFVRIERGIAAYRETGSEVELPFFQSFLAEAWLARGRPDEALAEIADVVRYGEQTGTEYYQPELKRLQGLALLLMGQPEQAEASFRDALKSARNRGARMLELRAAVSASQLWRSRGKAAEAAELLRSLLDAMTEGVETSDLKSARALLEEIAPVAVEEAQRHAAPRGNERRDVT